MRDRIRKRTSNITGMSFTDLVRMIDMMIVMMIVRMIVMGIDMTFVMMIVMMIVRMIDTVKIEKNTHRVVFN